MCYGGVLCGRSMYCVLWRCTDMYSYVMPIAVDEIYIIMHMQGICSIPKHAFPPKISPDSPYSGNMMYP